MEANILNDLKNLIRRVESDMDNYYTIDQHTDEAFLNGKGEVLLELLDLVSRYDEEFVE